MGSTLCLGVYTGFVSLQVFSFSPVSLTLVGFFSCEYVPLLSLSLSLPLCLPPSLQPPPRLFPHLSSNGFAQVHSSVCWPHGPDAQFQIWDTNCVCLVFVFSLLVGIW